ncbi:hypothetical protein SAMN05414137_107302 [Streptacidiphilus jiangxiensis]|uniref:Uncharacterized protein n=1 Tax=Streptacidiphilus jiangxiensis TaxID=235985 RepID=A0A1H7PCI6_STRJI|nr:hypothetical protein SAMN05414137_107302 [Streptacidiphilus jiangxiensis]
MSVRSREDGRLSGPGDYGTNGPDAFGARPSRQALRRRLTASACGFSDRAWAGSGGTETIAARARPIRRAIRTLGRALAAVFGGRTCRSSAACPSRVSSAFRACAAGAPWRRGVPVRSPWDATPAWCVPPDGRRTGLLGRSVSTLARSLKGPSTLRGGSAPTVERPGEPLSRVCSRGSSPWLSAKQAARAAALPCAFVLVSLGLVATGSPTTPLCVSLPRQDEKGWWGGVRVLGRGGWGLFSMPKPTTVAPPSSFQCHACSQPPGTAATTPLPPATSKMSFPTSAGSRATADVPDPQVLIIPRPRPGRARGSARGTRRS